MYRLSHLPVVIYTSVAISTKKGKSLANETNTKLLLSFIILIISQTGISSFLCSGSTQKSGDLVSTRIYQVKCKYLITIKGIKASIVIAGNNVKK